MSYHGGQSNDCGYSELIAPLYCRLPGRSAVWAWKLRIKNMPERSIMKSPKILIVSLCAIGLLAGTALADQAGCCAKASADEKDCSHPCCVAAAKDGKECEKCGGKGELLGVPGDCCKKARADKKDCSHPCCVTAAKDAKECTKCGGKGLIAGTPGGCCKKARADKKDCSHECCVTAAKDGKECTKCGGKGAIRKAAKA